MPGEIGLAVTTFIFRLQRLPDSSVTAHGKAIISWAHANLRHGLPFAHFLNSVLMTWAEFPADSSPHARAFAEKSATTYKLCREPAICLLTHAIVQSQTRPLRSRPHDDALFAHSAWSEERKDGLIGRGATMRQHTVHRRRASGLPPQPVHREGEAALCPRTSACPTSDALACASLPRAGRRPFPQFRNGNHPSARVLRSPYAVLRFRHVADPLERFLFTGDVQMGNAPCSRIQHPQNPIPATRPRSAACLNPNW